MSVYDGIAAPLSQLRDVVHLLSHVVLDIVDCEEAPGVVLVLLCHEQGPLIWRHLHACDLLDVL